MKAGFVVVLLAACNARLGAPMNDEVLHPDAPAHADSAKPPDAMVDARPCTGGDAHGAAPDGTCFQFFTGPASFPDAETACETGGAHLAKVSNAGQNGVVAQLSTGVVAFIGATDAVTEGTFLWKDGTPLTYMNFRTGEPNNGSGQYEEDCLVLDGKKSVDMWDDKPCTTDIVLGAGAYAYICSY